MLRLRNDTSAAGPGKHWLSASVGSREALWLALALALFSCLPVLLAERPQMTDYPSHLARYHIMLHGNESAWLQRYYAFDWRWTGNLGVDLLMFPLARLFGLELAGKLVAAAIPPLTGLAMIAVEWTLRRRIGAGTMLALATIWSPVMVIGLLNFALAFALALFAFALWVRLEGWRWRALVFLSVGVVVWLCHLAGWGVLGILVFGYEWHRRRGIGAFLAPWPLALPAVPMALAGGPAGIGLYGANVLNYKMSIWFMALRDRIWWLDIDSLALIALACLAALVFRRFDGRLGWAALFFVMLSFALPRHLGGGDYSDYRLIAVALTVGCLAIDWTPPRLLLWLAAVPFVARLLVTASAWQAESREVEAMLAALDRVPQGAHIAAAVAMDTADWATDTFQHVPSYATIRRDALVNTHFAEPGVHMLQMRAGGPRFQDPSQRILRVPGKPIDLAQFAPARDADYLWYIGRQAPVRLPAGAVVIHRTPRSLMARLAKAAPAR